ncbi:putative RNA-directed DNA polymerase [Helianthus annuus]|nr:putative RNA-directed DNA polymerase [Helianthus annuus]
MLAHGTKSREAWLWHRRLGHPSAGYLHLLLPKLFPSNGTLDCETCALAKSHKKPFKPSNTRVSEPFSLIHSDVWGPAETNEGQIFRFFLLFVDDCTRMTWVYFLKHKSEVFDKFRLFYTMVQTQFKTDIQILRSDNGGEYVNNSMKQFIQERGMIHQTTCPKHPEQNGVVERKNGILVEMARALMLESKVPKSFWPEAINTAVYLLNRLPTKALNLKTPIDALSTFTKLPPPLTLPPRVFGCTVFPHIPKTERSKLEPCAEKCVFVGYGVNQKGYRCYNPLRRRVITTVHCDFLETEYYYQSHLSGQGEIEHEDTLSWLKWTPSSSEDEPSHTSTHTKPVESLAQESSRLVFEVSNSPNLENNNHENPETMEQVETETMEQVETAEQNNATQGEGECRKEDNKDNKL